MSGDGEPKECGAVSVGGHVCGLEAGHDSGHVAFESNATIAWGFGMGDQ